MPQSLQRYAYPIALLALIAAFHWKLTLTNQYEWMWGPDLARQVLPWYEEEARQFHEGIFPTWDPHEWGGQPLLGQGQPGVAYPLNWLLFALPLVNGHISALALRWYYIAIHWMAGLFCYLLCRDLRLSRLASLAGGLIFALGGYVGFVLWPQMLNGAVWAPLIFLFLLRVIRNERPLANAAMCGLVWGMSWLSGHHQAPMFISIAAGFTWTIYILRQRSLQLRARLAAFALIACTFMFLTGALQLLPAQEYGHYAKRWVSAPEPVTWNQPVPYAVHTMFSLSPLNFFSIVIPHSAGMGDPFIGIIAFILVAFAVTSAWDRSEVKLFTALAVGGFAYALGFHNLFQGILYAIVPMLNMSRTPAMALIVYSLGVAVLAAYGIDQLAVLRDSLLARRTAFVAGGFGVIVWTILAALLPSKIPGGGDYRPAMTAFLAVLGAVFLLAWHKNKLRARGAAVLLVGLLMIDLGANEPFFSPPDDAAKMADMRHLRGDPDVARFLDRQPLPFRVDMDTEDWPVSWPAFNNFDEIKASSASITVNRVNTEFWTPQNRSITGVRFTIGTATQMPDAKEIFHGAGGLRVFENPHAFPRAWAVHEVIRVPTVGDGQALISNHLEDLHTKAFTVVDGTQTGPDPRIAVRPCAAPGAVRIQVYEPTRVTLQSTMDCDGMVVLSDTYYPGWKAAVDRKPAAVYEVNLAMRGVVVPAGTHLIEYRYQPASVYIGAWLTAIGILGSCTIVVLDRRRRRPPLQPKA